MPATTPKSQNTTPVLSARLNPRVALDVQADGSIAAHFDDYSEPLGKFGAATAERASELRAGLPLPGAVVATFLRGTATVLDGKVTR